MPTLRIVQIALETFFALICLLFALSTSLKLKGEPKSTKRLIALMFVCGLLLIFDVLALAFRGVAGDDARIVVVASNFLTFASNYTMMYLFFNYLLQLAKDIGRNLSFLSKFAMLLDYVVAIVMLCISQKTGLYYTIDSDNLYQRSDMFWTSQIFGIVAFLIFFTCILEARKYLGKGKIIVLFGYIMLPMIAMCVQVFIYGFSILNIANFLSVIIIFAELKLNKEERLSENKEHIAKKNADVIEEYYRLTNETENVKKIKNVFSMNRKLKHIFIVNPWSGEVNYVESLREKLSKMEDLDYMIFTTRGPRQEKELVGKLIHYFENDKLRIYCCGGSGTLRNILNGIPDLEDVEIAFYPCGMSNDLMKVFGEDEKYFHDIDNLIYGKVEQIDYIKTNFGVSLNTFSTGIDTNLVEKVEEKRKDIVFGKNLPYLMGLFYSIFISKPKEYVVKIDDKVVSGKMAEVWVGNGNVIGGVLHFAGKTKINDGLLNYYIIDNKRGFGLFPYLGALMNDDQEKLGKIAMYSGSCKHIEIKKVDKSELEMNFDGEIEYGHRVWSADVVYRGLNFVMPKEVKLDE